MYQYPLAISRYDAPQLAPEATHVELPMATKLGAVLENVFPDRGCDPEFRYQASVDTELGACDGGQRVQSLLCKFQHDPVIKFIP